MCRVRLSIFSALNDCGGMLFGGKQGGRAIWLGERRKRTRFNG